MLSLQDITERLRGQLDDPYNQERKRRYTRQLDVFLGAIEPYVRQELRQFYTQNEDFVVVSFANVAKKAVQQLARLYSRPPTRRFVNCSETQAKELESLYAKMKVDQAMQKANQLFKLSNQSHVQVTPTVLENGMRSLYIRTLPNQLLDVVSSHVNTEVAGAYGIGADTVRVFQINPYGEDEVINVASDEAIQSVWSPDYNFVYNVTRNEILSRDVENPFKMIPIVEISGEKYGSYWKVASESFADFTVQFNTSLTDAGQAKRFQGMPIGWVKGDADQLKGEFSFGPNKLIKLPKAMDGTQAEIGFTNPNVNLDALVGFDSALLSLFLTCANIDPTMINAKGNAVKYTSGYDRFLAMLEAFRPSEEDESLFKNAESRLVKVVARELSVYGGVEGFDLQNVGQIPDDVDVEIDFVRPEQIMSKQEELETIERELSLGLITRVEAVSKYRRVSMEAAQEFIDGQNQGA